VRTIWNRIVVAMKTTILKKTAMLKRMIRLNKMMILEDRVVDIVLRNISNLSVWVR